MASSYVTSGSGYFQLTLNGNLTTPIIIQEAPNQPRTIIQCLQVGTSAQNIMNIQGSNFMIKAIVFAKRSRGIRIGPSTTTNAIFDNIYIYNTTGTSFSADDVGNEYVNITLRNSEMTNTNALTATPGECVYFGCVNHLRSRAGFQVKSGSYNVVGPCIIIYDDYDRGRNLVDGNLAINARTADLGIQCTSGTTITNNVVINASINITISGNTVYMSRSDASLRLNGVTNKNITISNNVLYCAHQLSIKATNDLTGASGYNNAANGTISATGIQPDGILAIFSTNRLFQVLYGYNGIGRSMSTLTIGAYKYSTTNNSSVMTTNDFKCDSSTAPVLQYPLTC
ncbi:unnamed protein product [Rotaria socialis]|uniref:Uncharacterized protein n=1 Tax=Rotaria socialis TaxID=392032 RepID=A0A821F6K1_9BILA|nr:unnamed protein product [Rotaria socialis]